MSHSPLPSSAGFMRLPQVLALYPVSPRTWWAGVKSGRFPPAIKLGPRVTAWAASDIEALLERTRGSNKEVA